MSELFAGIDFGGTNLGCALADRAGNILLERTVPTHSHAAPTAVIDRMAALVNELAGELGKRPAAIGIGVPGLVDVALGITRFLPNLPTQWRDIPLAAELSRRLDRPVSLLNDVRTAALGELTFGHGRAVSTFAFFSIGTGIGGGLVIDRKLRLGPLGAAGEMGHQTILVNGPLCGCGKRGCLEALASAPAITAEGVRLMLAGQTPLLHVLTGGDVARVDPRTIAQAALQGDRGANEVLARLIDHLAIGMANVVTILHPEMIILGGGVAEMGEPLLTPLRRMIPERVGMFPANDVRVERSLLGDNAGILGAIALAMVGCEGLTR